MLHSDIDKQRKKGRTADKVFQAVQKQCILLERITSFKADSGLSNFIDNLRAQKE